MGKGWEATMHFHVALKSISARLVHFVRKKQATWNGKLWDYILTYVLLPIQAYQSNGFAPKRTKKGEGPKNKKGLMSMGVAKRKGRG